VALGGSASSSVPILLPEPQALIDNGYYGACRSDKMGKPLALRLCQYLRQVADQGEQRKTRKRTAIPSDFGAFANKPVGFALRNTPAPPVPKVKGMSLLGSPLSGRGE